MPLRKDLDIPPASRIIASFLPATTPSPPGYPSSPLGTAPTGPTPNPQLLLQMENGWLPSFHCVPLSLVYHFFKNRLLFPQGKGQIGCREEPPTCSRAGAQVNCRNSPNR